MIVADLMRTFFLAVPPDTTLRKANELMHQFGSDYILVTEGKKLLGLVTYSSLFRQILPSYDEVMQDETYWLDPASIEERVSDVSKKKVKEIMVTELIKIDPGMLVVEAGALMVSKKIKQLPVINSNGELVGVLSFKDITWGFLIKQIR
jgi:CBS domain-containing protein